MAELYRTKEEEAMAREKGEESKKTKLEDILSIASMNEDLLQNILSRLPAKSFAFAACVNRSWNSVCNRILSRPKILSAFSTNPDQRSAGEEVLDKVLSEPIRPDFVIANITCGDMEETLKLITKRVGSKIPIVVSLVFGILGKEACSDRAGEVKRYATFDCSSETFAMVLTIGYMPGLKVDVIPVFKAKEETEATIGDKFVMDIRRYVSMVSDHAAPTCLILFGEDDYSTEPIIQKLDYAMPAETIILGDQKGEFLHKSPNESADFHWCKEDNDPRRILAGLVFARDRHKPSQAGRIQFHTAISGGISAIDLSYKAANVVESFPTKWPITLLTARRRGEREVLNGVQVLDDMENDLLVGNQIWGNDPYIGVMKRRRYAIGLEKPKVMTSLVFHEVTEADEQYLTVQGAGIKTGDYFQVYCPDLKVAEASVSAVSSQFRNLKEKLNQEKRVLVGGFVFACSGRGDSFFGRVNVDSSPFLENFPELQFGGIFCGGEIGRSALWLSGKEETEEEKKRSKETYIQRCQHVYSSVYLLLSYTSASL